MMTISVQNESFLGRYNPIKTEIKRIRSAFETGLLSYPRIMRFLHFGVTRESTWWRCSDGLRREFFIENIQELRPFMVFKRYKFV